MVISFHQNLKSCPRIFLSYIVYVIFFYFSFWKFILFCLSVFLSFYMVPSLYYSIAVAVAAAAASALYSTSLQSVACSIHATSTKRMTTNDDDDDNHFTSPQILNKKKYYGCVQPIKIVTRMLANFSYTRYNCYPSHHAVFWKL